MQWLFKNSSTFIFHIFVGSTLLCVSLELQFTWRRILGLFLWCLLTVRKDVHAVWACSFSICEVENIGIQMLGHRVKWQRFCMQVEICLHIWKHLIWSLIHCRSSPSRLPSSGPVFARNFPTQPQTGLGSNTLSIAILHRNVASSRVLQSWVIWFVWIQVIACLGLLV